MPAPHIIGGYTTNDVKRRFEQCARQNEYQVEEWLLPSATGGLRVAATRMFGRDKHGLGFKWDGDDLNDLVARVMALDYAMSKLPEMVKRGKGAPWRETEH
jgi:hypothetical protein